jgi:hypothetical protein
MKKPSVKLNFPEDIAYKFVRFATRERLSLHVVRHTDRAKRNSYLCSICVNTKQEAFNVGAAWYHFMNNDIRLDAMEDFVAGNRIEELNLKGEIKNF